MKEDMNLSENVNCHIKSNFAKGTQKTPFLKLYCYRGLLLWDREAHGIEEGISTQGYEYP